MKIDNNEAATLIDAFLKSLVDASFPTSLAEGLELSRLPSRENVEKFKALEYILEDLELVELVRGRDNSTLGGQCEYWISSKGSELVRLNRSSLELLEQEKQKTQTLINMPMADNRIKLSTRRNILDGFTVTRIPWYGLMEQQAFLGRFYDLTKLPSTDWRHNNAGEDIYRHTVMNYDWPDDWVFTDARFNILHSPDTEFADFLCYTIHPAVRTNEHEIVTLLEVYNNNLKRDGLEIKATGTFQGDPTYSITELVNIVQPEAVAIETKKMALVVGVSNYEHASGLKNPANDATGMTAVLKSLGFEVTTIVDPTQKQLKAAIDDFGTNLSGADVGLFYFAGHGVQLKGLNYLIPIDAELKTEIMVEYDCVEVGRVLSYMEHALTPVNIIILDACRDNPFERSWGRGTQQRGLVTMNAPKGSLIAYSTAPGKTASDGDGENGLYTEHLLKHIVTKGHTVNNMFQKVRSDVMDKSKKLMNEEQIPWESTSLTADFYFAN